MQQTKPYGCHNRQRKAGYFAPDRKYQSTGVYLETLRWIVDTASTDCRYDRRQDDPRCKGCSK